MIKPQRETNIELLKVIAIVFITICHCLPVYGVANYDGWINENTVSWNFNSIFVIFLRHVGQIGNILFVICSAWFLVDNDKTKTNKIIQIILNTWVISIVGLLLGLVINVDFSLKEIIKQIFPTTFSLNWFVLCYLILYVLHGYLNKIINNSTYKELTVLVVLLFVIYIGLCTVSNNLFYYTKLVCFIVVYFITGYLKKYPFSICINNKKLKISIAIFVFLYFFSVCGYLLLCAKFNILQGRALYFSRTNYIVMILMDYLLFFYFKNKKIKYNPVINKVSSLSLVYYLITENYVFSTYVRPIIFKKIYLSGGYQYLPLWILIINVLTLSVGMFISYIYNISIEKMVKCVSGKAEIYVCRAFEKYIRPHPKDKEMI